MAMGFDTPLVLMCCASLLCTIWHLIEEDVATAVVAGLIGAIASAAAAGYWLSAITNIPGLAWFWGGLCLLNIVYILGEAVLTAFPSVKERWFGE